MSVQLHVAEAFTAVGSWYLTTQEQAMNFFCEHQGYPICAVFLELFQRVYSPLTAGLL
jgi:hypothetical protein